MPHTTLSCYVAFVSSHCGRDWCMATADGIVSILWFQGVCLNICKGSIFSKVAQDLH